MTLKDWEQAALDRASERRQAERRQAAVSGVDQEALREAIAREVSEWEVFTAGDGHRAIRMREARDPREIADSVLALPEVAALLAAAEQVQRVRELAEELERDVAGEAVLEDGAAFAAALTDAAIRLRAALDGPR